MRLFFSLIAWLPVLAACASTELVAGSESSVAEDKQVGSETSERAVAQKNSNDPDAITCTYTEVTGSRFRKKVCMTNAEREARRESAQAITNDIQRRNSAINPKGN